MGIKIKGFNDFEPSHNRNYPYGESLEYEKERPSHSVGVKGLDDADPVRRREKMASEEELQRLKQEAIKQAFNLTHGPGKRKKKKRRK